MKINEQARQKREDGRMMGLCHADLSADIQRDNIARCIAGISGAIEEERIYWLGYAETAWQIAKDIAFAPIDTLYGILPRSESLDIDTFRFVVNYQGRSDFLPLQNRSNNKGERLVFRWARCPWRWAFQNVTRYWNFENQEEFERQYNDQHGLVTFDCEPVDDETLTLFQKHVCPVVRTGYYSHTEHRWLVCEPTNQTLSHDSHLQKQ